MVHRSQLFDVFITGAQGSQTDFLGKFGEIRISVQGYMSQKFVTAVAEISMRFRRNFNGNSRLGSVKRLRAVTNVLSRVEGSEG